MIGYIALCDKAGMVRRVLCSIPIYLVNEGRDIRDFFADREKMDSLLRGSGPSHSEILHLKSEKGIAVTVTVKAMSDHLVVLVYDVDGPSQISRMIEMSLTVLDIPEITGREQYEAGYYEIQRLNSQLINYQRTQAKANVRLQSLLEEAREAKSTIEILERDPMTNLYTEKVFYDRTFEVLKNNPDIKFDIAAVDIEQFKIVNEIFGTETGDRLLADLSTCLLSIRSDERFLFTRARADTFFILMPRSQTIYDNLKNNVCIFVDNYPLPMRLQIKIGAYMIDRLELSAARMCDRALLAANSIKGNYNRSFAQYDDSMREKILLEQKIINTMEASLTRGDFHVYLQPKVKIDTGTPIGAEALIRWRHPEFGMIPPDEFIPVFEKNGFIYDLDLFVWRQVCAMLRNWKKAGCPVVPISVNVSRADLYHEDLPEILTGLVREYQLEPKELHLEITESAYVRDFAYLITVIERLKQAGFMIEMDDFGSGYSTLYSLSEIPLDVMKLDLKFLVQTKNQIRRQKIMKLVINLAGELQLQVLAEGVETEEQAHLLKSMGCQYAQGYLYGRPMPESDFMRFLLKNIERDAPDDESQKEAARQHTTLTDFHQNQAESDVF